ncbi:MAG TPA: DUF4242 domain-containing protein [Candidatus Krumholzibacteria bacterium]|nr:DUF4242 domain-containing protein [Candidatus Krumholzibacteria bacterium]
MPRYVIERTVPGVHRLNADAMRNLAASSNKVLAELAPRVQWEHSYVAPDKLFCVYLAENEELVREHAKRGQFPIDRVTQVKTIIDPTTAE